MKGTIPIPKAIPSASKPSPFLKNPNLLNYKSIPCYIGCSSSFWFLFKFKFRRQIIFLQIGETTRRRALEAARDQFWSLNIFYFFVISSREYFACLLYQCTLLPGASDERYKLCTQVHPTARICVLVLCVSVTVYTVQLYQICQGNPLLDCVRPDNRFVMRRSRGAGTRQSGPKYSCQPVNE